MVGLHGVCVGLLAGVFKGDAHRPPKTCRVYSESLTPPAMMTQVPFISDPFVVHAVADLVHRPSHDSAAAHTKSTHSISGKVQVGGRHFPLPFFNLVFAL